VRAFRGGRELSAAPVPGQHVNAATFLDSTGNRPLVGVLFQMHLPHTGEVPLLRLIPGVWISPGGALANLLNGLMAERRAV
jgi:hypothetical protein